MSRTPRALVFGSMRRTVLRCAILCAFVACVPPNGQYGQYPQPQPSSPSSSYDDEAYGNGEDGSGASADGGGRGRMWYCRAEATTVYGRGIDIMNKGRTRDEAALQALKDCGSLAGLSDVTSEGNEQRPVNERECEISSCWYAD